MRRLGVGLGLVDRGIGSGVEDQIGPDLIDHRADGSAISDVEVTGADFRARGLPLLGVL